jgi:hypothetical protein
MARRTKAEREHAREVEEQVVALMYEGIERNADDWRRDHLGASIIGHRCDRYLWLSFRWAFNPKHDGRQLRLFERGEREEPAIVRDMEVAGMTVSAPCLLTEEQRTDERMEAFRIWHGHIGGESDGTVCDVPGMNPEEWCVLEMKTSNKKQFDYLKLKRVRSAKPEHFTQMQLYMNGLGLEHALYIVVCKDTDELYAELVDLDNEFVSKKLVRAQCIIDEKAPPEKLDKEAPPCVYVSKDGTRWPCDFFDLCHGQAMPERNCRTCCESTPILDTSGEPAWSCENHGTILTPEEQRTGCSEQMSIPPIVNAQPLAVVGREVSYQFADGELKTERKHEPPS